MPKPKPFRVSQMTTGGPTRYFSNVRDAARYAAGRSKWFGPSALFAGRVPLMHCSSETNKPSSRSERHAVCKLTAAGKRLFKASR